MKGHFLRRQVCNYCVLQQGGDKKLGKDFRCLAFKWAHWTLFRGPDCTWARAEGWCGELSCQMVLRSQSLEGNYTQDLDLGRMRTCWVSNVKLKQCKGIEFRSKGQEQGSQLRNGKTGCQIMPPRQHWLFWFNSTVHQKKNIKTKISKHLYCCCYYVGNMGSLQKAANKSTRDTIVSGSIFEIQSVNNAFCGCHSLYTLCRLYSLWLTVLYWSGIFYIVFQDHLPYEYLSSVLSMDF